MQLKNTKVSKICNDYRRKEDGRCKKGKREDELYWNGHLIRRKTD